MRTATLLLASLMLAGGCGSPLPPTTNPEIAHQPTLDIRDPVSSAQHAAWLVIAVSSVGNMTATAFAISPRFVATNAHVVEGLIEITKGDGALAFIFNHATGDRRRITRVWSHPRFDVSGEFSPDVGLLEIDLPIGSALPLASRADVKSLEVFDEVILCGFPGAITGLIDIPSIRRGEALFPQATCLFGTISALRAFDTGEPVTPINANIIQYDLPTTKGTSGSAILNNAGLVIGVHAQGIGDKGDLNFAVRVDSLRDLIDWVDAGLVEGHYLSQSPEESPPVEQETRTWTLEIIIRPEGAGWVSTEPSRSEFLVGAEVEIEAHADIGCQFDHWSGNAVEVDERVTLVEASRFYPESARIVVAVFAEQED